MLKPENKVCIARNAKDTQGTQCWAHSYSLRSLHILCVPGDTLIFALYLIIMAMHITPDNRLKKLIVIGDRLLIKLAKSNEQTPSGLYLPPGVQEKEKVQQGYVIKTGPGYAIPMPVEEEPWKSDEEKVKYVPLQAKEGDLAIFLLSGATEVMYENEKYYIVPQAAVLLLEREEDL